MPDQHLSFTIDENVSYRIWSGKGFQVIDFS